MRDLEEQGDSELLRLSSHGNEAAFTALYRRHQGPVFRFALHMCGRKDIAEEVTQEVFLTLIRQPKQYRSERGALQAFLIGITRNHVRHYASRERPADHQGQRARAGTAVATPFESCSKSGELRALKNAILNLPPRYREVIALCDLEEIPYTEAARLLGCVTGTIRSRLHRARGILGARLRKQVGCSV